MNLSTLKLGDQVFLVQDHIIDKQIIPAVVGKIIHETHVTETLNDPTYLQTKETYLNFWAADNHRWLDGCSVNREKSLGYKLCPTKADAEKYIKRCRTMSRVSDIAYIKSQMRRCGLTPKDLLDE